MTDQRLVEEVEALLQERLEIPVELLRSAEAVGDDRSDAVLRLFIGAATWELHVECKETIGSGHLDSIAGEGQGPRGSEGRRLFAAREISPRIRRGLRKRKFNHVDLTGNIFINEPGLYIWLESDRKQPPQRAWRERALNPFSKKASLVLRALLGHPGKTWGIRELAAETGLSVGHASDIANEVTRRGYAGEKDGGVALRDGGTALRDWIGAYNWSKNQVNSFVVPFESTELAPALATVMHTAGVRFALTMLAGADRFAPHVQHGQFHVYVPQKQMERAREAVRESLYGEMVPHGGTLHVMSPYYGEGVFYGSHEVGGVEVVSLVQLFIDLAEYPLRGAEAARMLVRGPLANQLCLTGQQAQRLIQTLE